MVGNPVIAILPFGGYAEKVITPFSYVVKKPDSLSFEQGATIPVNYLTAYQLLVVMGGLKQNERLLIHNAGSGVGIAALDIAKHIGAITYGTASAHKHEFLIERGFENVIDYRTQDWLDEIKKITEDQGIDLIIDPIGGKNTWKSYRALARTGRLGQRRGIGHWESHRRALCRARGKSCHSGCPSWTGRQHCERNHSSRRSSHIP